MEKEKDIIMNDDKQPEWKSTTVKQVKLVFGSKDLNRLQSDINKELLELTLAHNQIESVRTYPVVELNTVRYIGEIIYSISNF